jgi:protein phosphatase
VSPPATRRSGFVLTAGWLPRIEAFGLSHVGLVRAHNEDSFIVATELGLCAVADGMGGSAAGEVASRMTVDAVRHAFEEVDVTWPGAMEQLPAPDPGLPRLVAAVERANTRVHAAACADRGKAGMGTTFTGVLVMGDRLGLAHVGDSRVYRLRGGRLDRLTLDHSLVEESVRRGLITPEEAERSPHKHVITRAIGTDETVQVDRRLVTIELGDVFLLATDGLHGVVGDDDIAGILQTERDLTRAASQLVEATLDGGAPDNVTAVLLRVVGDGALTSGDARG